MKIISTIIYFFRSKNIDTKFIKSFNDNIINQSLEKWKAEISRIKPDKYKLMAYVDDIHTRMLELGCDYIKLDKMYDGMFNQIKNL